MPDRVALPIRGAGQNCCYASRNSVASPRRLAHPARSAGELRGSHGQSWNRRAQLLHLGLIAYFAAYFWLAIPALLFTALDDVTSRWQVLAFLLGSVALTAMLLWLPLLLAHVAAERRWRSIFEFRTVRTLAGRIPFRWALTSAILFGCSALLLLYEALFKIRIPHHDAKWDLMVVFIVTVVPARVLVGWAYHRAAQQSATAELAESPTWLWRIWQWGNGAALCAGVGFYVYFLNLASTGGELGKAAIWQFPALLVPLPF